MCKGLVIDCLIDEELPLALIWLEFPLEGDPITLMIFLLLFELFIVKPPFAPTIVLTLVYIANSVYAASSSISLSAYATILPFL
jgi:hypothetical protein